MISVSSANCDQCFIKLRVFDVYPRHLTLSWFTISINVLKHKLDKSGDKLSPCSTPFSIVIGGVMKLLVTMDIDIHCKDCLLGV